MRTLDFKHQSQLSPLYDVSPAWLCMVLQSWVWSSSSKTGLSYQELPPGSGLRYGHCSSPPCRQAGGPTATPAARWFGVWLVLQRQAALLTGSVSRTWWLGHHSVSSQCSDLWNVVLLKSVCLTFFLFLEGEAEEGWYSKVWVTDKALSR